MKALPRPVVCKLFAFICLLSIAVACSNDKDPGELSAPVATDATNVSGTSFVANWNSAANATGYQIDLSTDNFTTFVTGYNSKSVTTTSETITGLTAGTTYKYRVRATNDKGASANSNEITVKTSYGNIATVSGELFTPTDLTLTDTNAGLELRMQNAGNDITFRLSDKVAGTYDLLTIPAGRTKDAKTAVALWITGGVTFYGESGTITVTVSTDGKVSLTFDVTGTAASGSSSTIANGKLENAIPSPPGIAQCALTTYSQTDEDQVFTGSFGYDSEGRLVRFISDGTAWDYFWTGSRITRAIYISDYELRQETWSYDNDVLTKLTGTSAGFFGVGGYEITYTYTDGKLTKAVKEDVMNEVPFTYTNIISYTGDNVLTVDFAADFLGGTIDSYTRTYSQYDTKNNFWQLLAESTNNPLPIGFSESVDGEMLSKNNVGKITNPSYPAPETQTYTYPAYSTAGYPTSLTYTSDEDGSTYSYSASMTYTGCN